MHALLWEDPRTPHVLRQQVFTVDGFTYERKAIKEWLKRRCEGGCLQCKL
jgi:hypothetical protein